MTTIEHYLRKILGLKPDSPVTQELINYLLEQDYKPDYVTMIKQ